MRHHHARHSLTGHRCHVPANHIQIATNRPMGATHRAGLPGHSTWCWHLHLLAWSLTFVLLTGISAARGEDSLFSVPPTLQPNPNERVPLVAIIRFETSRPVVPSLEFFDGKRRWKRIGVGEKATKHTIAAMGMRPGLYHEIRVTVSDEETGREESSEFMGFTTPSLPRRFPPLKVTVSKPEKMEPGYTMFCPNIWIDDRSEYSFGFLTVVNQLGEVVWYLDSGHRTADIRVLNNGNLLYVHATYRAILEVDMLGNLIRQWHSSRLTPPPNKQSIPVDVDTFHHELLELPSGNFLTISTLLERFDRFPTDEWDETAPWLPANVVCDELVEFVPETGEVVWRLPLRKLLDESRFGYLAMTGFWKDKYKTKKDEPPYDWSHANAVIYLPAEDAVIVSFRHLDCMLKIDRNTANVEWIFGDHRNWSDPFQDLLLQPADVMRWPYHQHAPQLTPRGTILMYDNGNYRTVPFHAPVRAPNNRSRLVEFKIDEDEKTVEQVWEYDGAPKDTFYCPFYGEAEEMPKTQNILVTDGGHIELEDGTPHDIVPGKRQWGRIFEITRDPPHEKVFEIRCDSGFNSSIGWSIYRSIRINDLYDLNIEPALLKDRSQQEQTPTEIAN